MPKTTTETRAFNLSFTLDDTAFNDQDFLDAFEDTIGSFVEQNPIDANMQATLIAGGADQAFIDRLSLKAKYIFNPATGRFDGGYSAEINYDLPDVVAVLQDLIVNAPVKHGLVRLGVSDTTGYESKHFYVMLENNSKFVQITQDEYNQFYITTHKEAFLFAGMIDNNFQPMPLS